MSDERDRTTPSPTGSRSGESRKRTRRGLTGRKIGPYRVTDEIGRGGMGVVYRAHDSALDRDVAIKVLPGHLGHDEEFMKRFVREARAAARVDHPGIVQVYQAGRMATETGDGPCFLAMQYVDGQPLSELIRSEGRLDALRAVEITKQVTEALGAAHAAGMIHRDIKSSNILVGEDGRVKVTDFGLATSMARDRSRITETGAYLGTPEYSSPEQCEGYDLDGRSDIYSLGVVLYEMLTGNVPFEANTPLKLFDRIVHEEPVSITKAVPGLPREVNHLVCKMLEKDPEKRYSSAEELLSALRRVRVALGSWKRGAGTGRRHPISGRYSRGQRRGELIVAGVVVAMLIGAGIGIWRPTGGGRGSQAGQTPSAPVTPAPGPVPMPGPAPVTGDVGVAVFDLEPLSARRNALLGRGISQFTIGKLAGVSGLCVYDREKVAAALKAAGGNTTAATRSLGARIKVTGDYAFAGDKVQVTMRVADVQTGKVADQLVIRGSEEQIFTLVDSIGEELRGRFEGLLAAILGRSAGVAAARLPSARECMFLAAAPRKAEGRRENAFLDESPSAGKPGKPGESEKLRDGEQAGREAADKRKKVAERNYADGGPAGTKRAGTGTGEDAGTSGPVRGLQTQGSVGGGSGGEGEKGFTKKGDFGARAKQPVGQESKGGALAAAADKLEEGAAADKKVPTPRRPAAEPGHAAPAAPAPKAPPPANLKKQKGLTGAVENSFKDREKERVRRSSPAVREQLGGRMTWSSEAQLSEALRFFFEGQEIMEGAAKRADYSRALSKFANARGIAPQIKGLNEAIEKARAGMEAAKK